MSEWLNPKEVAALLMIHYRTVIRWTKDGHLKAWRSPTGRWRYKREDVERLLNP